MKIVIRDNDCTEVWDGVLYKKLSDYPSVTDWEIRTLLEFIDYERKHGRKCSIECENAALLAEIQEKLSQPERYRNIPRPKLLTECTACPARKGCETVFVCHTTSEENAALIFSSGKLLSALKARNVPVEQLTAEDRNAARDPADYFEYVMLAWGNCQAGDRLVMERKLGRFPTEEDLSTGFTPGVRFYFRYEDLAKHPDAVFDGVLPMKVKDGIVLSEYVYLIIIPTALRTALEPLISDNLKKRTLFVPNDCRDIWEWTEKVYRIVESHIT